MEEQKRVVVSGYFDPVHVGHLEMFEKAKALGDKLIVIVNNDEQATLKKGKPFMKAVERKKILEAFSMIDEVFISVDTDRTVCRSLREVNAHIFANGGDRSQDEIPEAKVCRECGIEMVDELGAKIQSSSDLIAGRG